MKRPAVGQERQTDAVNLVVYVSDALRVDHVGCYGARFVNTRTIDELAAGGVRFDQVVSAAPWTCPSMMSMVTGVYAHRHGCFHWDRPLDPGQPTLFSEAARNDLAVASFVFDEAYLFKDVPAANVLGTSASLDGAVEWLRANRSRPFLLFVHSWATHMPYGVPHEERTEWRLAKQEILEGIQTDSAGALEALREAYRRAVEHQSEVLLASFLEELDALGLREETAIAFLSDHGESWGERYADKSEVSGIYFMHGSTLYDEVVLVPLVLSAPGRLEPAVVGSQVRSVDLVPTLLELAGTAASGTMDGVSLLRLLDGSEQGDRPAFVAGTDGGQLSQLALRVPPWKLIAHAESGEEEAYRLDVDPREQRSCPADAPVELRAQLRVELESARTEELSEADEAIIESRLADLGYL